MYTSQSVSRAQSLKNKDQSNSNKNTYIRCFNFYHSLDYDRDTVETSSLIFIVKICQKSMLTKSILSSKLLFRHITSQFLYKQTNYRTKDCSILYTYRLLSISAVSDFDKRENSKKNNKTKIRQELVSNKKR